MSSSSSLTPRNLTPIVIDCADADSANPENLAVQEDENGDEDDDVQIDRHLTVHNVSISCKQLA